MKAGLFTLAAVALQLTVAQPHGKQIEMEPQASILTCLSRTPTEASPSSKASCR